MTKDFPFRAFLNIPSPDRHPGRDRDVQKAMTMVLKAVVQCLRVQVLALALLPLALGAAPALAQDDLFAPAATVNGRVISRFELDQRVTMMQAFRQTGDIPTLALNSLIDDALRRNAAAALEVTVSPEEVEAGLQEFASRTNLPFEQFMAEVDQAGIAPETLRDFVEAGLLWRGVIRKKYAATTRISEAEIDRAIGAGAASGGALRLLLSEIVLPITPDTDAMALAQRIRDTAVSSQAFSVAAKDFSQAPTARSGGQLGWIGAEALPPELAPTLLALKPGEMTDPIVLGETVQLFYLRDLSQAEGEAKGASQVDFARLNAPAGLDLAAFATRIGRCDDLWGLARGLSPDAVQRQTLPEAALPADLRAAIARLDPGETAILGTSLIMLCSRAPASLVPPSRDDIRERLLNARLNLLSTAYLEELRSNAILRIE